MAFSGFLKLDGITGDATAPGYAKWLQLNSWSWGAARGAVGTPLSVQSFSFTSRVGAHSAKLLETLAGGKPVAKGTLAVTNNSATKELPAVQVKMDFTEVFLTVYDIGEDSAGPSEEQVSFSFRTVEMITGNNTATVSAGRLG